MEITRHNPPTLQPRGGLTHVVEVRGGRTLYLSGQGAYDESNQIVGPGDHYAQCTRAFRNVLTALGSAGADFSNIVHVTWYIVGLNDDVLKQFTRAFREVPGFDPENLPASTMIGVESLAYKEMLVEFDVTAVVE